MHEIRDRWFEPAQSLRGKFVYIAGPMRGIPGYNFPAFNERARILRSLGFSVANPAETSDDIVPERDWNWETLDVKEEHIQAFLKVDFACVLSSDFVMVLPNWWISKGARAEVFVAQQAGVKVVDTHFVEVTHKMKAYLE